MDARLAVTAATRRSEDRDERSRLPAFVTIALVVGLGAAAYPALSAEPAPPQLRAFTLEVTAYACPQEIVCLAYNGVTPGPLLDVNLGDTIQVTLVNRIAQTLPPGAPAHLATARVSWHVHGTAVSIENDGVGDSSAPPGGSFTYTTRAAFAGSWHYHDHVIGTDGDEGTDRGLYGGLIVRTAGEPRPDAVVDLHMLDEGANGGRGLDVALDLDGTPSFEMLVVGLENIPWRVTLKDPAGSTVGSADASPGLSGRIRVPDADLGTYRWSATGLGTKSGTVVVS